MDDWDPVFSELKKDLTAFVAQKKGTQVIPEFNNKNKNTTTLYTNLSSGENFGWGVCSKYFKKELAQKLNIVSIDEHEELVKAGKVNGPVFHAINAEDFSSIFPVKGTKNIGYTFFEYELSDEAVRKSCRL